MATDKAAKVLNEKSHQLEQSLIPKMVTARRELAERRRRTALLTSVASGVYDESDKLCKKAPAETVTDLALDHINHVISETKAVADDDPFISRIAKFVPAGENPEQRDVVLVLRQIIQGLERTSKTTTNEIEQLDRNLSHARGMSTAISLRLDHPNQDVDKALLDRYGADVPRKFLTTTDMQEVVVDFELLATTDLAALF